MACISECPGRDGADGNREGPACELMRRGRRAGGSRLGCVSTPLAFPALFLPACPGGDASL